MASLAVLQAELDEARTARRAIVTSRVSSLAAGENQFTQHRIKELTDLIDSLEAQIAGRSAGTGFRRVKLQRPLK